MTEIITANPAEGQVAYEVGFQKLACPVEIVADIAGNGGAEAICAATFVLWEMAGEKGRTQDTFSGQAQAARTMANLFNAIARASEMGVGADEVERVLADVRTVKVK